MYIVQTIRFQTKTKGLKLNRLYTSVTTDQPHYRRRLPTSATSTKITKYETSHDKARSGTTDTDAINRLIDTNRRRKKIDTATTTTETYIGLGKLMATAKDTNV